MLTEKEVLERYADVPLYFSNYYKYTFTFVGIAPDGALLTLTYGGSGEDIYRFDVTRDKARFVKDDWTSLHIVLGKEIVFSAYQEF